MWINIPGLEPLHGKVAWTEQWKVRVEFDKPFHPAVFETLVNRLRNGPGPA